jgi:hypothetical protein
MENGLSSILLAKMPVEIARQSRTTALVDGGLLVWNDLHGFARNELAMAVALFPLGFYMSNSIFCGRCNPSQKCMLCCIVIMGYRQN